MLSTDSKVSLVYSPAISSGIELSRDLTLLEGSVVTSLSHPPPLGTSSGTELSLLLRPNPVRDRLMLTAVLLPERSEDLVDPPDSGCFRGDSRRTRLLLVDKDFSMEQMFRQTAGSEKG